MAGFHPNDSRFQKRHGKLLAEFQGELSKQILGGTYAWINVGRITTRGHNFQAGENDTKRKTRTNIVPVNFGLKQRVNLTSCVSIYVGIGASYVHQNLKRLRARDIARTSFRRLSDGSWGGILKSGIQYRIWECTFLDFFIDYIFQPTPF